MSSNENIEQEKLEIDEYFKRLDEEHERAGSGKLILWLLLTAFIALCILIFVGVYALRSKQLDEYVSGLEAADGSSVTTESTEMPALDMIKIGIDDKTYTVPELATLDSIPTIVDVIIMYEDGSFGSKQAYISYANDDSVTEAEYIDGDYGRLILPKSMYHED